MLVDPLLRVLRHNATRTLATRGRVFIALWRGVATLEGTREQSELVRAFVEADATPAQLFLVVEATSPAPAGASFQEFTRFSRDVVPRLSAAVTVAEGGTFRVATVRSVAAALALVLPKRLPYKFAATVEEGATLLAPHLPATGGGAAGFVRAVAELRTETLPLA